MSNELSVAVLGAGNGGHGIAGHLALKGFPVRLYNAFEEEIVPIRERGGIELEGAVVGFGRLQTVTTHIEEAIEDADVIMASLDAATEDCFRQINRPHPHLNLNRIVDGLAALRKEFSGQLLLEFFVVNGCNHHDAELQKIKRIFRQIDADGILLNTLDRPAPEEWVRPVETNQLKAISDFLENTDVVTYSAKRTAGLERHKDLTARLVETIRRRPYTALDVSLIMGLKVEALQPELDRLVAAKQLAVNQMDRGIFYTAVRAD